MISDEPGTIPPADLEASGWLSLSPYTVVANSVSLVFQIGGPLLIASIVVAVTATPLYGLGMFAATLAVIAIIAGLYWLHISRTRYRVTEERFEITSGIVSRSHRSVQRDRIRSVDVTADVVSRVLGLAKLVVGTGEQGRQDTLKLEYITAAAAEQLRRDLLRRTPTTATSDEDAEPADTLLASMDWTWLRYTPLTVWTPALGIGALGGLYEVLSWFSEDQVNDGVVRLFWYVWGLAWLGIGALSIVVFVTGTIATIAIVVESWWGYRLEREDNKTILLRRGLLNTKVLSMEEQRLRGVEIAEPMPLRLVGAASLNVIATGLVRNEDDKKVEMNALTPDVPKTEAERIGALVLRERSLPTEHTPLIPHPVAALRRRLVRAFVVAALVIAQAVGLSQVVPFVPDSIWIVSLVVVPVAALLAFDAYRNLGHGLDSKYLLIRSGTFVRRTVVLRKGSVIGWTIRQSPFQRRAGVATFTATTAAGKGAYHVWDVEPSAGLAFADAAVPDILRPFMVDASN